MAKNWTTKEVTYVQKNALLAETNAVLNVDQLAKKLSRPSKSVEMKIYKMRKDGQLPKTDYTKAFDAAGRNFSSDEDKRIIAMYKQEETYKDIGKSLGRSEQSIGGRIVRLKEKGKIKTSTTRKNWSEKEIQFLIENIQFDENGYVSNYPELTRLIDKRFTQIQQKVSKLRKKGAISVQVDRTKTSIKSKKAMDKFNEARFAQYKKEEKLMPEKVAQTNVHVETQSKIVQMIMTVVVTGNERTINFFSMEGELLAVKKEPVPSANDTSH